ncbi:TIGR04500 family putative peptide maturation system protein [Archangium violaceum]|uniref:TIGR04500 family putative peptide maturation system protein n=1 Tax=Archangium violaceum TaxID=83451 RepID=UPI00194F2549|nr:TIGR04500 family putative peptide maturation system protein [Archangium violaceum]QRN97719.1 TIGR04500 family putative peptide maturation system protein [Archangium violaceum]
MKESLLAAVRDSLELLVRLRQERLEPDQAKELVRELKARHPAHWMNMVWEQETYEDKRHYDILVGDDDGTYSLGYCADESLPWPARGLQRMNESLVVRVNDEPIRINQVITSLDYAWHTLHIGRHLINVAIIEQELQGGVVEVTDEDFAEALLEFRQRRRLFTAAQVERWMLEHGTTEQLLENHLRSTVAQKKLRQRVSEGREEAWFNSHRAEFDRVQVARVFIADQAEAQRTYEQLRGKPGQFLQMAQTRFLERNEPSDLFVTLRRGEVEPQQAEVLFSTEPGQLAPPVSSGNGCELVQVLRFLPARFDEAMRAKVADQMFEEWLAQKRREARVEWYWGAAEAAPLPAVSL